MANFDLYAPALRLWEGGFAKVEGDSGGATNCGITLATFRDYISSIATEEDLKAMTASQWRFIAKGVFWDKCRADQIRNQSVAELIVDWCFLSGLGMIKKVQGIVGTKADGVVGPITIAAINNWDPKRLHFAIKSARLAFFATIVQNRSSNMKFYDGWINRVAALRYGKSMQYPR